MSNLSNTIIVDGEVRYLCTYEDDRRDEKIAWIKERGIDYLDEGWDFAGQVGNIHQIMVASYLREEDATAFRLKFGEDVYDQNDW
jgi:hypothetical protein